MIYGTYLSPYFEKMGAPGALMPVLLGTGVSGRGRINMERQSLT